MADLPQPIQDFRRMISRIDLFSEDAASGGADCSLGGAARLSPPDRDPTIDQSLRDAALNPSTWPSSFESEMSCVISARSPQPSSSPADAPAPRRLTSLFVWWLLLAAVAVGAYVADLSNDYKNITYQVLAVLAVAGLSTWLLRCRRFTRRARSALAAVVWTPVWAVTPLGPIQLINNGNSGFVDWRWRWAATHDQSLAQVDSAPTLEISWKETDVDYPRFLGNGYWAEARGVELEDDWRRHPPKLLWKQPIGAGWSAFAIVGDYAVTQEQRGPREMVVCYELKTGKVAWSHADHVRWDPSGAGALGGIGPRATPTIHQGRVYTHGATGIVNCIDAATGELLWSRDASAEFKVEPLSWGKADSPLIVGETVVISVGGENETSLVAFDRETGKEVWAAGSRTSSYASPVLAKIGGVEQILVVNEDFLTSHDARTGAVLWEHPWPGDSNGNASASQPVPVGGDRVFLSKGYGIQSQLVQVTRRKGSNGKAAWATEVVWSKPVLRTKLGNVVIRDGVVYGIDDIDMDAADLETGNRHWKKRRRPELGHGQIMLVGDKILVLSESGELVLLAADPENYRELATLQAIEGVTWNNLALAGRYLLVRNGEEAACFELPVRPLPSVQ
jgi:outer membrane protein assembly factor BamB